MSHFGSPIPFTEPYWYQGFHSAYYTEDHKVYRNKCRKFMDEEIIPNVDKWIKTGYPTSLHKKAYEAGLSGIIYPLEYGGYKPANFDYFYELIFWDELARTGGGYVLNQLGINSMALPPLLNHGSKYLKDLVCRAVITGEKSCCLAISEPWAGSDVANIQTTAVLSGDHYVVTGSKKWITGGTMGDFFVTAVRTGGSGAGGISLLLIPSGLAGFSIRKMETQFDSSHSTTFITLDKVKVPAVNLIGELNKGFKMLMTNFNHERFVLAAGATRSCRICYEESIRYAMTRKTFGKTLVSHQIIRFKLAEMVRQIEALQDNLERVVYQMGKVPDASLGSQCALLKVQASKCLEYCTREASQIFGGNSCVREGQGKIVERLSRDVRAIAIPGGSEEILLDLSTRQTVKTILQQQPSSNL